MTDSRRLRERQDRIRERPEQPLGQQGTRRVYPPGGDVTFYLLRYVDTVNGKIWGQVVEFTTDEPTEDATQVSGDFVRVYFPPMVQVATYSSWVRFLLDALTFAPITENPSVNEEGVEDEDERTAFEAAITAEAPVLLSTGYPIPAFTYGGLPTLITPFWGDPNIGFVDEQQQMNEGSGI